MLEPIYAIINKYSHFLFHGCWLFLASVKEYQTSVAKILMVISIIDTISFIVSTNSPHLMERILCTNRGELTGYEIIEDLGLIGSAVAPSKFIIKDIMASVRQIFGTEMKEYTQMIDQARKTVLERLRIQASELDADAIINIRFMATGVSAMSAEMMGYGTAVKTKKLEA